MSFRIICADVLEGLAQLPDESVHCVVTSPPYWGLRDYGTPGQIGLEPTLGEHIDRMVTVFREVRRVLRSDGTLWLNYGDCFATSVNGRSAADTKALGNDDRTFRDKPFSTIGPIYRSKRDGNRWGGWNNSDPRLKPKDLCMIPHRLAIALQEDGWWVRMDIVWAKPNPMPESVTDRPTKSHEYVFLMTKAERYFYDADAIKEDGAAASVSRYNYAFGGAKAERLTAEEANGPGTRTHPVGFRKIELRRVDSNNASHVPGAPPHSQLHRAGTPRQMPIRNKRSVWTIATAPFPEAHFATFPPTLPEICIKAGCPVGGTVLDPFAGAGTTLLVADRLERNAIGIELNPEYAAIAERRDNRGRLFDSVEWAGPTDTVEVA